MVGSEDDTWHLTVAGGRNLFLCEQRQKLILLLAWVRAGRDRAHDCGCQHYRGAKKSGGKVRAAGTHGSHQATMSEAPSTDS